MFDSIVSLLGDVMIPAIVGIVVFLFKAVFDKIRSSITQEEAQKIVDAKFKHIEKSVENNTKMLEKLVDRINKLD